MNWYPFYEGDYLRDTYHLSWDEDLAYRRLLDLCYRNDGRVTNNRTLLYRQLRIDENDAVKRAAVESVLKQFFKARGKSYQNQRVSKEVLKADQIHTARVKGGNERAKRAAELKLSSSPAVVSTSTSTTTTTKTPLPPTNVGVSSLKVLPVPPKNGLQSIVRWGQTIEVNMGRHTRPLNLGDRTAGMSNDQFVDYLTSKGYPARILPAKDPT